MKSIYAIIFASALTLCACGGSGSGTDFADSLASEDTLSTTAVKIMRFDMAAMRLAEDFTPDAVDSLLELYPEVADFLMKVGGGANPQDAVREYAASQVVKVFAPDIQNRLPSLNAREAELGRLKARMDSRFGQGMFPARVVGFATPYNQRVILLADTVALIGLNHYLGADYEGYDGFADYQRILSSPDRMAVDIAEAVIASRFPYQPMSGATALSRMLYEGALLHEIHKLLPSVPLNVVMGYTPEQLAAAESSEANAWRALVGRGVIYSVDPLDADRLVMPAPYTYQLGQNSTPRMGRYIGYKLIEKYIETNPEISPRGLLSPAVYSADSTLVKSKYTGQ